MSDLITLTHVPYRSCGHEKLTVAPSGTERSCLWLIALWPIASPSCPTRISKFLSRYPEMDEKKHLRKVGLNWNEFITRCYQSLSKITATCMLCVCQHIIMCISIMFIWIYIYIYIYIIHIIYIYISRIPVSAYPKQCVFCWWFQRELPKWGSPAPLSTSGLFY